MDLLRVERSAVSAIAAVTAFTGAAQMAAGEPMLSLIAPTPPAVASHLFATVGMFMLLFGGATLHAQRCREALPVVLLWSSVQKLLAAALVASGVVRGVFTPVVLAVAAFDFVSGLIYLDLRRREG